MPSYAVRIARMPEVIDATDHLVAPTIASERELADVRAVVRGEAVLTRVVDEADPAPRAPRTRDALETILRDADRESVEELIFVRYRPARSRPTASSATFEMFVVSPQLGELLCDAQWVAAQHPEPPPDRRGRAHARARQAIRDLFELLVESRRMGHPRRRPIDDLAALVLAPPQARVAGERIVGAGWSFDRLEGWSLEGGSAGAIAELRAPDRTRISVVARPTALDAEAYARANLERLRQIAIEPREREVSIDGHPALEIESRFRDGTIAIQRVTSTAGHGYVFSCIGAVAHFDAHRGECARVLGSITLEPAPSAL